MAKFNIYKDVSIPVKVLDIFIIAGLAALVIITAFALVGSRV